MICDQKAKFEVKITILQKFSGKIELLNALSRICSCLSETVDI